MIICTMFESRFDLHLYHLCVYIAMENYGDGKECLLVYYCCAMLNYRMCFLPSVCIPPVCI